MEPNFGNFVLASWLINICFWEPWEKAFLGKILAKEPFGAKFGQFGLASWLLKAASGNLGKKPFWDKSWPRSLLEPNLGNLGLPAGY